MREVAVRLVDEQHRAGLFGQLDQRVDVAFGEHRASRVVRTRDADQLRLARSHTGGESLDVEPPVVVERQVDDVDVRADGARCLEVGRVVRAHDDCVVTGFEQCRRRAKQCGRRARRDEHVVGSQSVAAGCDTLTQPRIAEVVAVAQQQLVDVDVEPEISEPPVGDRALREVVGDRVVAELLGRLDLDRHSSIAHVREVGTQPPDCAP